MSASIPAGGPRTGATLRADARACLDAAIAAVEPCRLVEAALARDGDRLVLAGVDGAVHPGPVLVVGAGKAAVAMALGVAGVVPAATGLVIAPHDVPGSTPRGIVLRRARHPVPDDAGLAATSELLHAVAAAGPDTLVLVVLSGGASSLLVAPADGLSLADKQGVTRALLAAGADIVALNTVRKHCSRVKGGGLARAASRAAGCWTLALSDVVGDDPAVIGSGPTVADPTTFADAEAVLRHHLDPDVIPSAVRARVRAGCEGRVPETPKAGDAALSRARFRLVGSNRTAVEAAAAAARARGHRTVVLAEPLRGDAADAGRMLGGMLAAVPGEGSVALVAGGETTVAVVPGGRGGRSQQLALSAALALSGAPAVVLAAGTDGVDGPTDAAGACVDGATAARARAAGLDPVAALAATDAYTLLAATGDLVRTGPTGTNVADVVVAIRAAC